jgi:hypothetical protein
MRLHQRRRRPVPGHLPVPLTQIANLRWLQVAVQERILAGEIDGTERDLRKTRLSD